MGLDADLDWMQPPADLLEPSPVRKQAWSDTAAFEPAPVAAPAYQPVPQQPLAVSAAYEALVAARTRQDAPPPPLRVVEAPASYRTHLSSVRSNEMAPPAVSPMSPAEKQAQLVARLQEEWCVPYSEQACCRLLGADSGAGTCRTRAW
jgi:hypothetical protein